MTNNEILKADLLDIIFENRNKDYGAYALRREYNHRLLMAVVAAFSVILLFIALNALPKKNVSVIPVTDSDRGVVIRTVELPKEKEPEKPKEIVKPKPAEQLATVKHVSMIAIKPDKEVRNTMTAVKELEGKLISAVTTEGKPYTGIVKPVEQPVTNPGTGTSPVEIQTVVPVERQPEFPGGPEALKRFLANNLVTPEDLEIGEKKMVQVRFKVDKDGAVSGLEILSSGGNAFDREVLRVCNKMPRWKPAFQNGVNVPVSYILPVTFVGVEQ